jgi:hypothetical protein
MFAKGSAGSLPVREFKAGTDLTSGKYPLIRGKGRTFICHLLVRRRRRSCRTVLMESREENLSMRISPVGIYVTRSLTLRLSFEAAVY